MLLVGFFSSGNIDPPMSLYDVGYTDVITLLSCETLEKKYFTSFVIVMAMFIKYFIDMTFISSLWSWMTGSVRLLHSPNS